MDGTFARRLALALALAAGLLIPAGNAGALTQPEPDAGAGMDRIVRYEVNLDADAQVEVVFVSNDPSAAAPRTVVSVWDKRGATWDRTQFTRIFEGPGAPSSGLETAVVADINGDGRFEIAARHFVTPSVGEVMIVLRQPSSHALSFTTLQTLGADQVTWVVSRPTWRFSRFFKPNHSPTGKAETEYWNWSPEADRWLCALFCAVPGGTQSFTGSAVPDTFAGGNAADTAHGRAGNDALLGFAGNDRLFGQSGADRLIGGVGNDLLDGGSGNDRLVGGQPKLFPGRATSAAASDNDRIYGGSGIDTVTAGAGNDFISVRDGRRDVVSCGSGIDRVSADRADRLTGCERVTRR